MVTEFELMDAVGKVLARGEIDNGIYRLFSNENPSDAEEFETLELMLAKHGGVGIQPSLFETPARTRQEQLFQEQDGAGDRSCKTK